MRWLEAVITRIFIDSTVWHRWWRCHRLPDRSFALSGRQFHICARCTGLITGTLAAPLAALALPASAWPLLIAGTALIADGLTQLQGWRQSTNSLRFLTGAAAGATIGPAIVALTQIL